MHSQGVHVASFRYVVRTILPHIKEGRNPSRDRGLSLVITDVIDVIRVELGGCDVYFQPVLRDEDTPGKIADVLAPKISDCIKHIPEHFARVFAGLLQLVCWWRVLANPSRHLRTLLDPDLVAVVSTKKWLNLNDCLHIAVSTMEVTVHSGTIYQFAVLVTDLEGAPPGGPLD